VKPGWRYSTLGEACEIKPPKSQARRFLSDDEEVSFMPMEDLGIDTKYPRVIRKRALGSVAGSYTYFADGDVLLAKITPCFENGKLGIARELKNGVGFGSSEFIVLRHGAELMAEWLYYYLVRQAFRDEGAKRMSGAVGHKRVAKEFVDEYPIPLPSLAEQRRLVAILDEAFAGIAAAEANAEKNLQNAYELFDSYQRTLLAQQGSDWVESPLSALGEFRNGVNFTKRSKGHRIRVVGVKDFKNDFDVPMSDLDVVQLDGSLSELDALRENDILFVRSNGNPELIGRCLLAGPVVGEICHSGFTIRLRLSSSNVLPRFLCHYLKSSAVRKSLTEAGTGANIRSLNQQMLAAVEVPIPSLAEQATIVMRLESMAVKVERLNSVYQAKLAAFDTFKQSMLASAFAGEL